MERQRTPDDIRAEIEQTRADMDETVQAISYRLSPGQIVDQMWDRVRTGDAAASFAEVVKEHPVPAMLMGLGLGWLMYERSTTTDGDRLRRKYGDVGPGTYAPAEGRVGPYMGEDALAHTHGSDGVADKARSVLSSVKDAAAGVGEKVSGLGERAGELRDSAAERVSELRTSAGERMDSMRSAAGERLDSVKTAATERAEQVRERTSELAGRARQTATTAYDEQPLAIGALAFGLGLASGLAVPASPVEDRVVGERSDRIKDEVRQTASEKLDAAKRVAAEARDAAQNAVRAPSVMDVVKQQVRTVVEETRTAAMQAAEREGLLGSSRRQASSDAQASTTDTDAANRIGE